MAADQEGQSGSPEATGYTGFYYHFLDMHTGARMWRSGAGLRGDHPDGLEARVRILG